MKYFDPSLGIELPERSYADACVLTKENVMVSRENHTCYQF